MAARAKDPKISVGQTVNLGGQSFTIIKTGAWECVVEGADGSKRYPRTATVKAALAAEPVSA
jgi:hypothetical protein